MLKVFAGFALLGIYLLDIGGSFPAARAPELHLGSSQILLRAHEWGDVSAIVSDRQGGIYALDGVASQVLRLDSAGNQVWRHGRKGHGPGEYQTPYLLATGLTGGVLVLDWRTGRMTRISAAGRAEGMSTLPMAFTQLEAMHEMPDGKILLAASAGSGLPARHSLHLFSANLVYIRSFAPLATGGDSAAIRAIGSGPAIVRDGRIVLTLNRPYSILQFDLEGRRLGSLTIRSVPHLSLDELIQIRQFNGQTFKGIGPRAREVELAIPAHPVPAGFIGGLQRMESAKLQLIRADGTVQTVPAPAPLTRVHHVDTQRQFIYGEGDVGGAPVLVRVPYVVR